MVFGELTVQFRASRITGELQNGAHRRDHVGVEVWHLPDARVQPIPGLWSIRLDGSNRTRLTAIADAEVAYTMLAPDGRQLAASLVPGQIVIGSAPFPITRASATTIEIQKVGGGGLFPSGWSPDGRWLTGPIIQPSGVQRGNALYDVKARTVRQLSDDAGSVDMVWMADHTRVIYFTTSGQLVIQNIDSRARRQIAITLPLPPDDMWSIAASADGRTLYYGAQQVEANIWKVEQPKAAANDPR